MPQHKSAAKRVRQTEVRRARNRIHRSKMRTMIKKLHGLEDQSSARDLLVEVKSYVDRMASKGIIHKNKAGHTKSQLDKFVNSL